MFCEHSDPLFLDAVMIPAVMRYLIISFWFVNLAFLFPHNLSDDHDYGGVVGDDKPGNSPSKIIKSVI